MKALTVSAAAREMGIDRHTLKALLDEGKLPYWYKTDAGRYVLNEETLREHARLAAVEHIKEAS